MTDRKSSPRHSVSGIRYDLLRFGASQAPGAAESVQCNDNASARLFLLYRPLSDLALIAGQAVL
jgi:hypothetical protein